MNDDVEKTTVVQKASAGEHCGNVTTYQISNTTAVEVACSKDPGHDGDVHLTTWFNCEGISGKDITFWWTGGSDALSPEDDGVSKPVLASTVD